MASSGLSLLRRAAEAVRRTPRWQKRLVFFTVGYVHRLHLPYAFPPFFFLYCFLHPFWLIDPCAPRRRRLVLTCFARPCALDEAPVQLCR